MSNQLEQIKKLYAKTKVYTIPREKREGVDQVQLEVTALSLEDMGLLDMKEDLPLSELARNAKILFAKSLKVSEEEASKISIDFMEELLFAVMDANNFKESDMEKTGIKSFIEKKKQQIEEQKK